MYGFTYQHDSQKDKNYEFVWWDIRASYSYANLKNVYYSTRFLIVIYCDNRILDWQIMQFNMLLFVQYNLYFSSQDK